MIDMWSYFQAVDTRENHSAGREEMQENAEQKQIEQRRNTPTAICGQPSQKR